MAKKQSSLNQPPLPNPYKALTLAEFDQLIHERDKEIHFLRQQIQQASDTISGLVKALNEKKTMMEVPARGPLKVSLPKFFNPKTKDFEVPSKDELAEFGEHCDEILGFRPALVSISEGEEVPDGP